MDQLQALAHQAPLASAGVLALLLIATFVLLGNRRTHQRRAKSRKQYEEREKLAAKPYAELAEDYHKLRAKLSGKHHEFEVVDILQDISDNFMGRDNLDQRITNDVALAIVEQIGAAKDKELVVVLHTLGGYAFPSEMIAEAIRNHPRRTRCYVPYVAMSGGTIIALAADEIFMGKAASLGPIDAQFGPFPADAYQRLIDEKPKEFINDATLLTSYVVQKYEKGARDRAADLLNKKYGFDLKKHAHSPRRAKLDKDEQKKNKLAVVDRFMNKDLFHGAKISADKAKGFGVPIAGDCPKDVYALVNTRLRMLWKSEPPPGAAIMLAPVVHGMPAVMHEAPGMRNIQAPTVAVDPKDAPPPQAAP